MQPRFVLSLAAYIMIVFGLTGPFLPFSGASIAIAQGLVVIPSERVTQFVNIRDDPSADGDRIARLHSGVSLPYVGSVPRWHEVSLDENRTGFVSKSWTTIIPAPPAASAEELRIHFLSIGAGTCTVVECPGTNAPPMIVDCGSSGGRGNVALERSDARQRVQEILGRHSVAPNVVLSHGDIDHYNWVPHVLDNVTAQHIWQGGEANTYGTSPFPAWLQFQEAQGAIIHQGFPAHWHNDDEPLGTELSCGLASTYVLTVNSGGSKNTDSLVLMIEYEDFTAIFPGDAVGITEEFAEANFSGAVKASVLSASHHGAETFASNSPAWVAATAPEVIIYSSGQRHGHPRCPVTGRYGLVVASAPDHQTHCNDTNDYDRRQITSTGRAEYVTDVVGSMVVTSNGKSPMRLTCEAVSGCAAEVAH